MLLALLLLPILCFCDSIVRVARITDVNQLKNLIKAKDNVLVYYHIKGAVIGDYLKEVANNIDGTGYIAFVYCDGGDNEKTACNVMGAEPDPFQLKHYFAGDFYKDYDGKISVQAITRYMENPGAEPWVDDVHSQQMLHINNEKEFIECLAERKPTFVLFYKPDDRNSIQFKPIWQEFSQEADKNVIIAAVDLSMKENEPMAKVYKINAFPIIHYFSDGVHMYEYEGRRDKDSISKWFKKPMRPEPPKTIKVEDNTVKWENTPGTLLTHLNDRTFNDFLKEHTRVMAVFHAPWCGYCLRLKPTLENVVRRSKAEGHPIQVVAVDGTKNKALTKKYGVFSYPKMKYFINGQFKYDQTERNEEKILQWMRKESSTLVLHEELTKTIEQEKEEEKTQKEEAERIANETKKDEF